MKILIYGMVNRFLGWKLPKDFCPDGGITFNPGHISQSSPLWPVGTNLLTSIQAEELITHLLVGINLPEEADAIIAEHISTNKMLTAEGDRHRQIIAEKDKEIEKLQSKFALSDYLDCKEELIAAQARIVGLIKLVTEYEPEYTCTDNLPALAEHDAELISQYKLTQRKLHE